MKYGKVRFYIYMWRLDSGLTRGTTGLNKDTTKRRGGKRGGEGGGSEGGGRGGRGGGGDGEGGGGEGGRGGGGIIMRRYTTGGLLCYRQLLRYWPMQLLPLLTSSFSTTTTTYTTTYNTYTTYTTTVAPCRASVPPVGPFHRIVPYQLYTLIKIAIKACRGTIVASRIFIAG